MKVLKILLVDDDKLVRDIGQQTLASLGHDVASAHNGETALNYLRKNFVDVLFTDIMMPGLYNGIELAKLAIQAQKDLKVILVSGFFDIKVKEAEMLDKGFIFLQKPYRRSVLTEILKNL